MAKRKPDAPPAAITVVVDERWIADWLEYGFVEMSEYLEKQAAFDAYCKQREAA